MLPVAAAAEEGEAEEGLTPTQATEKQVRKVQPPGLFCLRVTPLASRDTLARRRNL